MQLVDQFGNDLNSQNAGKLINMEGEEIQVEGNHKLRAQVEAMPDEQKLELRGQLLDTYGFVLKMAELSKNGKYASHPQTMVVIDNLREIVRAFDPEFVADLEEHGKNKTLPVRKEIELRAMLQTELNEGAEFAKEQGYSQNRATTHLEKIHRDFYKKHYNVKLKNKKGSMHRRLIGGEKARKVAAKAAAATSQNTITEISEVSF